MSLADEYRQAFSSVGKVLRKTLPYLIWISAFIATVAFAVNQFNWGYFASMANSPESLAIDYESSYRSQIPESLSFLVLATTTAIILMRWIRILLTRRKPQRRGFEVLVKSHNSES